MKKHVHSMITGFRDGFQSCFGARVLTRDFLPAFEAAVAADMTHLEVGGGARFQSLYFYCNEDAFEMHDTLRKVAGPDVDFQTLARGINVVALDSQPSDVIDLHARLFRKHSITTIRNFDALNDVGNLVYSGRCIVNAGLRHEVCVTMMGLPPDVAGAHDADFYLATLRGILDADIPYSSVCFKDASGTTPPSIVHDSIAGARSLLGEKAHIVFHSHDTAGISIPQYLAALDAGADQVDCSLSPVSGGTCQPDIITLWQALRGTRFDLGLDIEKVREVEAVFRECMADYFIPPEALAVEPMIPFSPMPGGALTANTQMMRDNGILDRFPEVIHAMGEAVAKGGFGTSVTPVSQFYFQQAFNNVMFGSWERIAEGYGKMVLGYFGKTPLPPDPEVVKRASEALGLEPTTRSPLEIDDENPKKGVAAAKATLEAEGLPVTDESIFIVASCKEKGVQFLKGEARVSVRKIDRSAKEAASPASDGAASPSPTSSGRFTVRVNGVAHDVVLGGSSAVVDGVSYAVAVAAAAGDAGAGAAPAPQSAAGGALHALKSPFPAQLLRIAAGEGAAVKKGAPVVVIESMKMETVLSSPVDGAVASIAFRPGDQLQAGQVVAEVRST